MAHKTPVQCDDGCCDDGCPPGSEPVVSCTQDEYGFHYTVTNAAFAEVRVWCPSAAVGDPDTTYPVTLDVDGNATGTVSLSPGCKFCIYARNHCDESLACSDCDVPCCEIKILPSPDEGKYIVNWQHHSYCNGVGAKAAIASITINGAAQTLPPLMPDGGYSGSFTVAFGDSPKKWCMIVTNTCGVSSECCVDVACCFRTTAVVLESSGFQSTYSRTCSYEQWQFPLNPPIGSYSRQETTVIVQGLDGLNGSLLLTPDYLSGYALEKFKGFCHVHPIPIPLGISGWVEVKGKSTNLSTAFTDPCGVNRYGNTRRSYLKWSGEFALYMSDFGQQIVLIPDRKQQITFRGWIPVPGRGPCEADPLNPCAPGGTIWGEDSRYCIYDVALPVGVHVASICNATGYGGPCPPLTICDEVADFCTSCVGVYERISPWGYLPRGYNIGCPYGVAPPGFATPVTCDNGAVDDSNCGGVGYGSQRWVYSVQI